MQRITLHFILCTHLLLEQNLLHPFQCQMSSRHCLKKSVMDLRKLFNEGENNSKKGSDDESFGPIIF